MRHSPVLDALMTAAMLAGFWLLWSGHWDDKLLLGLGAFSVIFTLGVGLRMGIIDKESHPYHLAWRPLVYIPWLLVEIVKANIDVTKRIFSQDISPTLLQVKCSQKSELGQVIYANSITLTPGTISLSVVEGHILVHALSKDGADDLEGGGMDKQAAWLEGQS